MTTITRVPHIAQHLYCLPCSPSHQLVPMLVLHYIMKSSTSLFMYPCSYEILMLGAICKITPSSFDSGRGGAFMVKALQVSEWIGLDSLVWFLRAILIPRILARRWSSQAMLIYRISMHHCNMCSKPFKLFEFFVCLHFNSKV